MDHNPMELQKKNTHYMAEAKYAEHMHMAHSTFSEDSFSGKWHLSRRASTLVLLAFMIMIIVGIVVLYYYFFH